MIADRFRAVEFPDPNMTSRTWAIRALAALLLGLVAQTSAADPVAVETATVESLASYPERSAPASAVALDAPRLSAQIAARVVDIAVRPGDEVQPDEVLVTLECADYALVVAANEARLEALEAQVELARQKLERARRLAESKMTAEELVDERVADLARLKAERRAQAVQLETAQVDAGRCRVVAPARSLVMSRLASEGDLAQVGTALVELVALDSIEISAEIYAPDAGRLTPGTEFAYEASGERTPLTLRAVVGAVDPASRTREIRLLLPEASSVLPGSAGRLVWRDPRAHLPASTLVRRDGRLGVFVVEDGKARFVPLPDAEVGRDAPVSLAPDTRVVRQGHLGLSDGQAVATENER